MTLYKSTCLHVIDFSVTYDQFPGICFKQNLTNSFLGKSTVLHLKVLFCRVFACELTEVACFNFNLLLTFQFKQFQIQKLKILGAAIRRLALQREYRLDPLERSSAKGNCLFLSCSLRSISQSAGIEAVYGGNAGESYTEGFRLAYALYLDT